MQKPTSQNNVGEIFSSSDPIVEISTPTEYNYLVGWLMASANNATGTTGADSTGRRQVKITADLDFTDVSNIITYKTRAADNLEIDGQNHKIKNISYTSSGDDYIFARVNSRINEKFLIRNIVIQDCYFSSYSTSGTVYFISASNLDNVIVRNCIIRCQNEVIILDCYKGNSLGCANTVYVYRYYIAIAVGYGEKIVCIDDIYGQNIPTAMTFDIVNVISSLVTGFIKVRLIAFGNKAINIRGFGSNSSTSASMFYGCYAVFKFEGCEDWVNSSSGNLTPFVSGANGCLIDSTLIDASGLPSNRVKGYGKRVTTQQLKSKEYLLSQGWAVM